MAGVGCGEDAVSGGDADTRDTAVFVETIDLDAADGEGPEVSPPPAAVIRFALPASGLPDPLSIPFPSDLYREGADHAGSVVATLANWELAGITKQPDVLRTAYAGLDGFGHTAGALFRIDFADAEGTAGVSPTLDEGALPRTGAACLDASSPVAIVDVTDPAQPTRLPCIASYFAPLQILVVAPEAKPLVGGRRYAVVVSDRLTTSNGGHLGPSPAFTALRQAATGTPAATLFGTAIERVVAALPSWSAESIAGMAVYSAHTEHRKLRTVRDALVRGDYGAAPGLLSDAAATAPYAALRLCAEAKPGCAATLDEWLGSARRDQAGRDVPGAPGAPGHPEAPETGWPHDAIAVVIQGAFKAPELRRPWGGTPEPDDGTFEFDGAAAVAQPEAVTIPVSIVLPKSAPPSSGYPVVIFSHGTPSNRQFVMTFANELARAGVATVAIDGLYHGVRSGDGDDARNNFPGTFAGPDGFADKSETPSATIALSATLQSAPRYRANLWQYAIEWCQLRRFVANPDLDLSIAADQYAPGTDLSFDGTRIGWLGTSFGAFTGAALLSVESGIQAWFLNAGNGDGLQWQGQSPANHAQIELVLKLFGMGREVPLTRFTPFVNIAFGALEPGFAASSTEDVDPAGPDILMTEVEYDEFVPNRSTELLAAALGIKQVVPAARPIPLLGTVASPVIASAGRPARGLVYMGSASHSSNLGRRWGQRKYSFPDLLEDAVQPQFPPITPPLWVRQPVVATQAMMVRFFQTAFAGAAEIDASEIPAVIDFDDDGWCDATERAAATGVDDPSSHPGGVADCLWDPGF